MCLRVVDAHLFFLNFPLFRKCDLSGSTMVLIYNFVCEQHVVGGRYPSYLFIYLFSEKNTQLLIFDIAHSSSAYSFTRKHITPAFTV